MWKGISIVSGISIILSFLINIYFYKKLYNPCVTGNSCCDKDKLISLEKTNQLRIDCFNYKDEKSLMYAFCGSCIVFLILFVFSLIKMEKFKNKNKNKKQKYNFF